MKKETKFLCIIFILAAIPFCLWLANERQANAEVKNAWSPDKELVHEQEIDERYYCVEEFE